MWFCRGRYARWCRRSRAVCFGRIFLWPCLRSSRCCCPGGDAAVIYQKIAGADVQDRTGDLVLTKDALCQLSYIGSFGPWSFGPGPWSSNLERETGIEPATNSLEGCDSTTELLPPLLTLTLKSGHLVIWLSGQ